MGRKTKRKNARNPTARVEARPTNTGYSDGAASIKKTALATYRPIKASAKSDINAHLALLRNRSNDQAINTPIGASAINTSRTHTIGAGLKLFPRINYKLLGMDIEAAIDWERRTAEEFDLWASSKICDLYNKNNFYDLQDIAYTSYLIDGDSFAAFRRKPPTWAMPYSLRLQLFEANRVSNPYEPELATGAQLPYFLEARNPNNGNRIISGVEIDGDGAVVAYWVSNKVPGDPYDIDKIPKWTRVEAFGKRSGMPNILQISHDDRSEQYRGVPYLSPVIETLKQISRYSDAELTAAIIKSFFTLFFVKAAPGLDLEDALPSAFGRSGELDINEFMLGSGTMNALPQGWDVKSIDASRTLSTFEAFTTQLITQVAAAIGQPYEVVMKRFTSSYSASRAALLQAWEHFKMRRTWFTRDFCQPVYEAWFTEAVAIGRIDAPGFFDDPLLRKAWCNAAWYGPVMAMIDPVKDAEGAAKRIEVGISTGERESAESTGTDYLANIERQAVEEKMRRNIRQEMGLPEEAPAQPGTPAQKTGKEEKDDDDDDDSDDETVLGNQKRNG